MRTIKVLLVDDEPTFVETMKNRLMKRGMDITTAYSGQEALGQLEKDRMIEVVILDVKMPKMDGIATLTEIKRRYPLTEVIMLTAHSTIETAISGMKLGAFDYLFKPCEIATLVEKTELAAFRKREHDEKIIEARMKEITNRRA